MREGSSMSMPEQLYFDRSHIAAIKANHINKSNGWQCCFDLLHIKRIVVCIILHHPAWMPVPAVTPGIQCVGVGTIIGFCPGDEIDQCLLVAKIALSPISEGICS